MVGVFRVTPPNKWDLHPKKWVLQKHNGLYMDLNPPKKDVHKAYIGFALLKMGFTSKKT